MFMLLHWLKKNEKKRGGIEARFCCVLVFILSSHRSVVLCEAACHCSFLLLSIIIN